MASRHDVFNVAAQAVEQRLAGDIEWLHGGQMFDLDSGGMCARFVRQCYETAMGISAFSWAYCAGTARDTEAKLKAAGLEVSDPQPGDIVCFNNQAYSAGHIAIYAWCVTIKGNLIASDPRGVSSVFENTSSGVRGNPEEPGTKVTPFAGLEHEVSGFYSPLPA
jgi:hypothetical protein